MSQSLRVATADGDFSAYVARPDRDPAPAIVVIQEIFGVNAVMRGVTDEFARAGFLAICPDLFWRIEPGIDITDHSDAEWKRAFELYNAFDVDAGVRDIAATIDAARTMIGSTGRVGVVGFCLGGFLAFLTATRTDADAAVGFYGLGIDAHLDEADHLTRPLMLHIAEEDQFVSKDAQARIIEALGRRPGVVLHRYPGRDHAFAREGGAHYDAADAALAMERTLALLRAAL